MVILYSVSFNHLFYIYSFKQWWWCSYSCSCILIVSFSLLYSCGYVNDKTEKHVQSGQCRLWKSLKRRDEHKVWLHRESRERNRSTRKSTDGLPVVCQKFKNRSTRMLDRASTTKHIQSWLCLWGVRSTKSKDDTGVMRSYDHTFSLTFNKNVQH